MVGAARELPDERNPVRRVVVVRRPAVLDVPRAEALAGPRLERGVATLRVLVLSGLVALAADEEEAAPSSGVCGSNGRGSPSR